MVELELVILSCDEWALVLKANLDTQFHPFAFLKICFSNAEVKITYMVRRNRITGTANGTEFFLPRLCDNSHDKQEQPNVYLDLQIGN